MSKLNSRRWLLRPGICAAAVFSAAAAHGAPAAPDWAHVIWDKTPSAEAIDRVYPIRAKRLGYGGIVLLDCVLKADGSVQDCAVSGQTPETLEFGAAALKLAPEIRAKADPALAGKHVRVPITFKLDGAFNLGETSGAFMQAPVEWARRPSLEDLEAARPVGGEAGGSAVLRCWTTSHFGAPPAEWGRLLYCSAVQETPLNSGFGAAAASLAPKFQLDPSSAAAADLGAWVQMPVSWRPRRPLGQ